MRANCALCESNQPLFLNECGENLEIVACGRCGLVWNREMLDPEQQIEFYREKNRAPGRVNRRYLISMLTRAACILDFLEQDIRPGMRHLDVGCAEGTLLSLTRLKGLEVTGLELDVHHSQFARAVRGLDVFPSTLDAAPYSPNSFDLVSLVHVVEHLYSPVQVLQQAWPLLVEEGLLYVEVPNINQPLPRARRFFRFKHNFYFSANTLKSTVYQAGFEPLRLSHSRRDRSLQLLARKRPNPKTECSDIPWKDDAAQIYARLHRERDRYWLLLRALLRVGRQKQLDREVLARYKDVLGELKIN